MVTKFHVIFLLCLILSISGWSGCEWIWKMSERSGVDVENERAEWMWTISEDDKVFTCI